MRSKPFLLLLLSSLFLQDTNNRKTECCDPKILMTVGSGIKDIQALIPIVGSGEGRQCGRDHTNNLFRGKNLRMGDMEQDTHTKREREREILSLISNSYNEQPTFTKGYKVTLYSDSLRTTALYAYCYMWMTWSLSTTT